MRLWLQLPFLPEKILYVKYLDKSSFKKNCSVKKEEREEVEEEGKGNKRRKKKKKPKKKNDEEK